MTIWTPNISEKRGPKYRAIVDVLAEDIEQGTLRPETRLPTHRELAERLGVTIGTVSRAYAEGQRRALIRGEVGRGTFVRTHARRAGTTLPEGAAGFLDLGMNFPAESPATELGRTLAGALQQLASRPDLDHLLQYQPHAGIQRHRSAGAAWIGRSGLQVDPRQVLVCNGSQHALTVTLCAIARPGDVVLTEALTYPGMKVLAKLLHLELRGLPLDADGLIPEAFETACREAGSRILYSVPTIQNPTGSVMPLQRRREIVAIARAHRVTILEDDIHGLLPDDPPPPLASLYPEHTFYIASTSKSMAPGLRIAYLHAPPEMQEGLSAGIWATAWMAAPLMAELAAQWIEDGTADRLLATRREEAAARQQMAAEILSGYRLEAHPRGYHLWLHLAEPWRAEDFTARARARGVGVTPPAAFIIGRGAVPHAVRLCLGGVLEQAQLRRALEILRDILSQRPGVGLGVV